MTENRKAVLEVDDSTIIQERLKDLLSGLSHVARFTFSNSYKNGMEVLSESNPDIVLLDINLPDKSGIDLLKQIKHSRPGTVVIILSNQSSYYYKKKCRSLGADYFVDKSNEFESISEIIDSLA